MNIQQLQLAANEARGLAMDAVHACSSGHLGLPLGCAEIGAVLWADNLQYHAKNPRWINRDRFVLSAGHGSMFIYSWLHLAGYELGLDELKNFRKLDSLTPGHPEYAHTAGVECTTGPLGQGVANSVGFAISGKRAAAVFNTPEHSILDYHVVCLAGDGCLQEGVAREAISLAGHLQLDNLILIFDSNKVTLDAMADVTQSEDYVAWFEAQNWEVFNIDGHDLSTIAATLQAAKQSTLAKPKIIIANTEIGRGIVEVAGTAKAHGEGGANFIAAAKQFLGLPAETFHVSQQTRALFAERQAQLDAAHEAWQQRFAYWQQHNPELAQRLADALAGGFGVDLDAAIPAFASEYADATRSAGGVVINHLAAALPDMLTGSADLYGSTKNYLAKQGDFSAGNALGRNLWFGIREHAMGAILNGIVYDGFFKVSGATFLVFADYLRPSIRVAALSGINPVYIFTHDSVAVGEDGPTHQPVETVSGLRLIPNLDVLRPADPEETAGAFVAALQRREGPSAIILTRQKVATQNELPVAVRRRGVHSGAYVALQETSALQLIIMASGSELDLAMQAAKQLGGGVRVVSVPCMERFERLSKEEREAILPSACTRRLAVEAGVSDLWWKHVGLQGRVIGIDRFGLSAPGGLVLEKLGISVANVLEQARELLAH